MRWRPVGTFLNVGVDLKNSTDVARCLRLTRPRLQASIARFTSLAFDLPVDSRRWRALSRPCGCANSRGRPTAFVAEQLQRATEALQRQLSQWGSHGPVRSHHRAERVVRRLSTRCPRVLIIVNVLNHSPYVAQRWYVPPTGVIGSVLIVIGYRAGVSLTDIGWAPAVGSAA